LICPPPEENPKILHSLSLFSPSKNGPLTINVKLLNQSLTATLDHGSKASIIHCDLTKGFKIYNNVYFLLSDFGHNHIFDGGFALLSLQIGNSEIRYPFFVVKDPPCP